MKENSKIMAIIGNRTLCDHKECKHNFSLQWRVNGLAENIWGETLMMGICTLNWWLSLKRATNKSLCRSCILITKQTNHSRQCSHHNKYYLKFKFTDVVFSPSSAHPSWQQLICDAVILFTRPLPNCTPYTKKPLVHNSLRTSLKVIR